jgi:hypothetical protein
MPIRQEKFQVSFPKLPKEDPRDHQWVFPSQDLGGLSEGPEAGAKGVYHRRVLPNTADGMVDAELDLEGTPVNRLNVTPSAGIRELCIEEHQMALSRIAGDSDVSDYVASPEALRDGFTRCPMVATDDQYTGEHVDLFYTTARGSDDTGEVYDGFVERNNYLDRE